MVALTLSDILSSYSSAAKINANNALIEAAVADAVSKSVITTMLADLDLNDNFLINLPTPTSNHHAATKLYVDNAALGDINSGIVVTGMGRFENGDSFPDSATGPGLELFYDTGSSQAVVQGWNRTTAAFVPLELRASELVIEPNIVDTVTIVPASTSAQAIRITSTGPTSGTAVGPFFFNQIEATVRSALSGSGGPGDPASATWVGLQTTVNAGGASFDGVSVMGGSFGVVQTIADTSTADKNGLSSGVHISAATAGKLYGGSGAFTVESGGDTEQAIGYEVDCFITGTGIADVALGFNSWKGGTGSGGTIDGAYSISCSGAVGVAPWEKGFVLYKPAGSSNNVLANTADLFWSNHTATISSVFNFDNITVSDYILKFPNVLLSGGGELALGNSTVSGGIGLHAPTNEAAFVTFEQNSVPYWTAGLTTDRKYAIANIDTADTVFSIDPITNLITIDTNLSVTGTVNSATINENAWTTYTPTLTSGGGTITTSTSSGRYKRLFGRTVIANVRATLTTVGTASGSLNFTLPINASTTIPAGTLYGREVATTGKGVNGTIQSATVINCVFSDAASIFSGGDGTIVDATIIYETAA